jgi:tetratricopeptide (TPR) repeat protein
LDPRFLEALITKAQLLMIVNRLADALELLDEIVKQDPNNYQGQYYRGTAQVLAKQYESAVSSFRHAVRLRQDSARAHVALAEALSLTGRTSEALDEYRAALHLDPENDRALQEIHRLEH